jgi:Zn finger protein HypA/HybF involved in hydrogenase expression
MHEAALASAVAETIRERGLDARAVRLRVSGGHTDVDAFDAALRFHLAAISPDLHLDAVPISHVPEERPCLSCGQSFAAVGLSATCPRCGGVGLGQPGPEHVEIETD